MRTVLLVALSLGLTGCWKTIHEPGEPPVQDAAAWPPNPVAHPAVPALSV